MTVRLRSYFISIIVQQDNVSGRVMHDSTITEHTTAVIDSFPWSEINNYKSLTTKANHVHFGAYSLI